MAGAGVCAASLLGELLLGSRSVGFNYLFIFPPCYVAFCASKARHRLGSESVSWCLKTSLFLRLPSRDGALSLPLLSFFFFCLLYFFLPPFEDNGLLFWVPDVLCWHSEVVFWNLLSVKCSFDAFVGEEVVPLSYSSNILSSLPFVCLFLTEIVLFDVQVVPSLVSRSPFDTSPVVFDSFLASW